MKKVLYGLLWFMIFWVGSASVMGLTLNRIAAFQGKTPEQEKKMVEEVGQLLGKPEFDVRKFLKSLQVKLSVRMQALG